MTESEKPEPCDCECHSGVSRSLVPHSTLPCPCEKPEPLTEAREYLRTEHVKCHDESECMTDHGLVAHARYLLSLIDAQAEELRTLREELEQGSHEHKIDGRFERCLYARLTSERGCEIDRLTAENARLREGK